MKSFLLFSLSLILGTGVAIFILTQTTTRHVSKPKKDMTPLSSKFSLKNAPSLSLRGTISALSGDVFWQSRTATEAATITSLPYLQQGEELITSTSGKVTVHLANNCIIRLQPRTHLNFVQTLPQSMVIELKKGDVTVTKNCSSPFSLKSLHLLTQINQGESTFSLDDEEGIVSVEVHEGNITVAFNDSDNVSNILDVEAGQTLIFDDENHKADIE